MIDEAIAELEAMSPTSISESRTCGNCKFYDGSHKCNNCDSIAYGSENRLYPEDGCIVEWEKKDEKVQNMQ